MPDIEWLRDSFDDALPEQPGASFPSLRNKQHVFVPADAARRLTGIQAEAQDVSDVNEDPIPCGMPKSVIDPCESIQIQAQDSNFGRSFQSSYSR